mgnify:CR=1 FL=1
MERNEDNNCMIATLKELEECDELSDAGYAAIHALTAYALQNGIKQICITEAAEDPKMLDTRIKLSLVDDTLTINIFEEL